MFIPSPSTGVWYVFGFPLRAYALCIIAGIIVAMVIASRRWVARGGTAESLEMCVVVAIPFGIVGARLYHVITDYELYFGPDAPMTPDRRPEDLARRPRHLGGGRVRRARRVPGGPSAQDRLPGPAGRDRARAAVAQAIGRLGNWFNQELFGRPTTLPWGLEIDQRYRPLATSSTRPSTRRSCTSCSGTCRRAGPGPAGPASSGSATARSSRCTSCSTRVGRFWIEALRIDTVNEIGGFRLNNYTSLIVFVAALMWFVWLVRTAPDVRRSSKRDRLAGERRPRVGRRGRSKRAGRRGRTEAGSTGQCRTPVRPLTPPEVRRRRSRRVRVARDPTERLGPSWHGRRLPRDRSTVRYFFVRRREPGRRRRSGGAQMRR